MRELARSTRLAYTDAQAAVGRSLAEPPSKRIDPDLGPGILAALRRVTRALHGLRTEPLGTAPVPGAAEFATAMEDALLQVSDALGVRRARRHPPPAARALPPGGGRLRVRARTGRPPHTPRRDGQCRGHVGRAARSGAIRIRRVTASRGPGAPEATGPPHSWKAEAQTRRQPGSR